MKKIQLLGLALLLFSCSQEDSLNVDSQKEIDIKTVDGVIGYKSPYIHDLFGPHVTDLEHDTIEYTMENTTNLEFKFVPFFGFAFQDGVEDLMSWGYYDLAMGQFYSPNLIANGNEYGNYLPGNWENPITLINESLSFTSFTKVPYEDVDMEGFTFVKDANGLSISGGERIMILTEGKLFYIKFEISDPNALDANNNPTQIVDSYVKNDFPMVSSASIYSNTYPWITMYEDSFFNEKMVYNQITKEICVPITEKSQYTNTKDFVYLGKRYQVGIKTDTYGHKIYLKEI